MNKIVVTFSEWSILIRALYLNGLRWRASLSLWKLLVLLLQCFKEKRRSGANSKGFWIFLLSFAALLAQILLNNHIVQLANCPWRFCRSMDFLEPWIVCQFRWNCSHPSPPSFWPSWPAHRDGWLEADFRVLEAVSAQFNVFCREQDLRSVEAVSHSLAPTNPLSGVLLSLSGLLCRNKLSSSKMFHCKKVLQCCIICLRLSDISSLGFWRLWTSLWFCVLWYQHPLSPIPPSHIRPPLWSVTLWFLPAISKLLKALAADNLCLQGLTWPQLFWPALFFWSKYPFFCIEVAGLITNLFWLTCLLLLQLGPCMFTDPKRGHLQIIPSWHVPFFFSFSELTLVWHFT